MKQRTLKDSFSVKGKGLHTGLIVEGKVRFKNIKGGVLLVPTDFTIKDL